MATNKTLINSHRIVPHKRFGNEQAFSVTGGTLKRGQIVHGHPMHGKRTIILMAIAQDDAEQAAEAQRGSRGARGSTQ